MINNQMKDKNVIVTGANCGIGYETALELAKRGAHVILACRDETKAKQACEQIKQESKNDNVEVELLDLSKLQSIKAFSERIIVKLNKLDVLINNAGLAVSYFNKTEDGFETTFGVNHLGPYYLTRLLLDLIKRSAPSRIVNVSSLGHRGMKMNWTDLQSEKSFSSFNAYAHSKLANILFTNELAERLRESGVTCVSLHPGVVKTEIVRMPDNASLGVRLIGSLTKAFFTMFGKTAAQGAATSVYCATDSEVTKHSGAYYE